MKWLWLAAAVLASNARAAVTTTSASHQFTVEAPAPVASAALCAFAERLKHEWLQQLDLADSWRDPIFLIVRDRDAGTTNAPVMAADMYLFESQLRYRLTCVVPPAPDDAALGAAIIELLCAELANHDQPHERGKPYIGAPIPVWLSEGLAQSVLGRPDQLLTVVRRSAIGSRPQTAMELMRLTALPGDAADRTLYRASAWLLTESLLRLPDGRRKLARLLTESGATKIFARAFTNVYGDDFPDTAMLEKWWSLQQARTRETTVAQNFTPDETARRLDALLGEKFDQLWRRYDEPTLKPVLQEKLAGLQNLHASAHPLYRPVIAKYAEAVAQLLDTKLNRFRRAAAEAGQLRAAVERQMGDIREALDRAEHKYVPAGTNEFAGFFHELDRLEKLDQQRHNPISDYLDQFDK
jgi:hypothetical protein